METSKSVKLLQAFNSWERRQFEYGVSDCCSFVAHVTSEISGRDYRKFITYESEDQAYAIIEAHGGFANLMDSVFSHVGEPKDGDPCLLNIPIVGELMGIKYQNSVVCVTKHGLTQIKDRYIIRGWNLCHR